jgi:hypothetical protein
MGEWCPGVEAGPPCHTLRTVTHRFEFDPDHRILLAILEGEIQDADLLAFDANSRKYAMKFTPVGGISDFSGITAFSASGEVVRTIAQTPPSYKSPLPWLLVAPRDVHYGMARMYQIIASDVRPRLKVVRSFEEALTALGVQNPKFEPVDSE